MHRFQFDWLTERRRAYIYRVLTLGEPLVVAYGVASETRAALWLAFVGGVLGVGMAAANTSTDGS